MYDAWNDPQTLSIVSKIAGIDLVPVIDIEIGNINVSVQDPDADLGKVANQSDDDIPVTKWHNDSYPFVCVVMMSDTTGMVGGETALRTGSGDILKVRGPQMVRYGTPVSLCMSISTFTTILHRDAPSFFKAESSCIKLSPP